MDENLELYSEVLPNLFIGGTHDEDTVGFPQELRNLNEREEFDAVVTCYSHAQPMSWYYMRTDLDLLMDPWTSRLSIKLLSYQIGSTKNGYRERSASADARWDITGLELS